MKTTRNLRKDVTLGEKFHYIALAVDERDCRSKKTKWKTDLISNACQYSSQPKLKREDFDGILDMTIKEIANKLKIL
jgi:hypothetical protein